MPERRDLKLYLLDMSEKKGIELANEMRERKTRQEEARVDQTQGDPVGGGIDRDETREIERKDEGGFLLPREMISRETRLSKR